jgi:hypothetical protein
MSPLFKEIRYNPCPPFSAHERSEAALSRPHDACRCVPERLALAHIKGIGMAIASGLLLSQRQLPVGTLTIGTMFPAGRLS